MLRIALRSQEKDGCLNFASDSVTISEASQCGDRQVRNLLNNVPLLSAVNITPNPLQSNRVAVSFSNTENISLSSELSDVNGKVVIHRNAVSFLKGRNKLLFEIPDIASGTYSLHLLARTLEGRFQNVFSSIILSH